MSPDEGRTWTNIFVGKINGDEMKVGDTISGKRADVPRRKIQGSGTLTLIVKGSGQVIEFLWKKQSQQVLLLVVPPGVLRRYHVYLYSFLMTPLPVASRSARRATTTTTITT
jgi:hypothetical protein